MIREIKDTYRLDTENTTYIFRRTRFGHMEHIYYGRRLKEEDSIKALERKTVIPVGSSVMYSEEDEHYCLDSLKLEWSDNGRGDYRQSPTEFRMPDGSFTTDFVYANHRTVRGNMEMETLPSAYGASETLVVTMKDKVYAIYLDLYYTVYEDVDVITRRVVVLIFIPWTETGSKRGTFTSALWDTELQSTRQPPGEAATATIPVSFWRSGRPRRTGGACMAST